MDIEILDNTELTGRKACDIIYHELKIKPDMLLCAASGSSPLVTYRLLAEKYREDPGLFDRLRVLKLDEWGGISMDDPQSCEIFLQENIVQPLGVSSDRYISFDSNPENPADECTRIAAYLKTNGPIETCVLGLGLNGHIAFNEPGSFLQPYCHIATLSEKSLQHPMASGMGRIPAFGLTLGVADILQSKKIIMLISGNGKKDTIQAFLSGKISTQVPASLLWLHGNVTCMVDKNAMY